MTTKISILMSNYNKAAYLKEAIESVINQTYGDWELILLDDGSTDESEKIIKNYLQDSRIKYCKNKKNIGRINSLIKMVELAQSPVLGILDSDDALDKDALREVMKIYDSKPDIGLVYTQCYYCDEKLEPKHLGTSDLIPENSSSLHKHSVHHFRTFRKTDFNQTDGYDHNILTAEDYDIVLKLEEATKLYYINKPLYYYRILKDSHSHSFKNTKINRSSTALAKLNAYKRRQGTDIPNLNRREISEVLFFGIFTSLLAGRFKLTFKFIKNIFKIHPIFFLDPLFYCLLIKKIKKIIKLKKHKPLINV